MEKPLIIMSSITNAMRGRELLRRNGIPCEIERVPKSRMRQGCGYGLYVRGNTAKAEELLRQNGLRVSGITDGRPRNDIS